MKELLGIEPFTLKEKHKNMKKFSVNAVISSLLISSLGIIVLYWDKNIFSQINIQFINY